ncbi:MAG TPA: hypothetical protein DEG17_03295 [Cyanobacteria bacterium UBA11149]|nr:hypothetical protein [Cyanobacteria bacterium UBA11367]HBE56511.1 hypothetical protein [Cyanobacteria bacterium UBA11366]HBK66512.1 hypothetical protein [Cyanobacteria bacterium UBA11166]HBR72236.1 hypothetical protein [Cyanobacteria bacterium UBA11159]HBS70810.1 hypothetical protein [Cyanobacteria bacterium UBA11153]HBW87932.1 hypothetical protein [Cyanobacteria bacterium UBA11149]HCA97809.1 hypothetical protein [Cyanobacteria bacterium UBA9226]
MQCSLQWPKIRNDRWIEHQSMVASPCRSVAECDHNLVAIGHSPIYLNLEDLKCFEVVENQFQHYGAIFKNAIALQPSNPAYPPHSGTTVLMAAPKSGWLEIVLSKPITSFCCYVTSSQRTIMSAYNSQNVLISKIMTEPNLAGSDSSIPPNFELKIHNPNISRITFYAFDGQLTIANLTFEF